LEASGLKVLPRRFCIIAIFFALPVTMVRAEPVDIPSGVPSLSASIADGETMIDAESVDKFATLVLPALEHLVKKGGMPLPAIQKLPFPDYSSVLWKSDVAGGIAGHFPFPLVREEGEAERALQIIKNGEFLWQFPPALEASVSYFRFRASFEPTTLRFKLTRSYQTAERPYSANQLFREFVSFEEPSALSPLQFFTIRFSDQKTDRIWEQSGPAGTRSLEPWLRQERAAGGLFVLDDLFVNSGSAAAYDYGEVQSTTQLVPFSAVSPKIAEEDNGCVVSTQDSETPQFNAFSKRFVRALGWVPTELVFVPRRVFLIKAFPRSPYSHEAELLIVVDRETMLPVMKVVRSDTGGLLRVVLGAFSIIKTKSGSILPVIRHVISVTGGAREVDALSFDSVRRCGAARAIELREQLDTRSLLKADSAKSDSNLAKNSAKKVDDAKTPKKDPQ